MELTGIVKKKGEIQDFASGFQKIDLVIQTEEQYSQSIQIEFSSGNVNLLQTVEEGDRVKIGINIRGREWQAPDGDIKYFNSIVGWRIEKV